MSWIDDTLNDIMGNSNLSQVRDMADELNECVCNLADRYLTAGLDPDETYCIVSCYNEELQAKGVMNQIHKELCDLYLERWYDSADDTTEV